MIQNYPEPERVNFSEALRYAYNLNSDSRVIDIGFHEGEFSRNILEKFNCTVEAYEPVEEWVEKGLDLTSKFERFKLTHAAVGAHCGFTDIRIHGSMSGRFADGPVEVCPMMCIDDVIGFKNVDLLKLNVEGAEFDILERMIKLGLTKYCRNIQVQFHTCAPDAESRYVWIRHQLRHTHHLTYDFPWCWENWERNE